jgi:hypothetical protein
VKRSGPSLETFMRLSEEFRAFDDPVRKLPSLNAIMLSGSGVHPFADEPLPAIDYHLVRHAVRQGMVTPSPHIASKMLNAELLTPEEGNELRLAVLDAFLQISQHTGLSGEVLDNKFWHNRNICGDPADCGRCPFAASCEKHVSYGLPLELTRYY